MTRPYSYFSRLRTRHTRKSRIAALRRHLEAATQNADAKPDRGSEREQAGSIAAERAEADL